MVYDWSAYYKKIETPNRYKGEMFCPIIKDDVIYISKCEVVKTFKDVKMPQCFIYNDNDLKFNINLKIEKIFLGIFKYKTDLYLKNIQYFYLSKSFIDSLEKTLYTFKDSKTFKNYDFEKNIKNLIVEKNLGTKKFSLTTNHFCEKLTFNKEVKEIDYSKRVCI